MIDRIARNPWLLAGAFTASALLGAGLFAAAQAMVPGLGGDRAQVEAIVRTYILEHPEILPEAMDRLQARQLAERDDAANAALAKHAAAVVKPFGSAWAGNPAGDVTVVAFMDYNCGYCRANLPALAELIRSDPGVKLVYREFPVLGDESVEAARWALAAAEQGKFKPFHEAMFAGATIPAAAARAGLDMPRARTALQSPGVSGEIARNRKLGVDLHLSGTPGWVIGKRVYHAALDYDSLVKAVAEARKAK